MSRPCVFAKSADAHNANWASRRHRTIESREAAVAANDELRAAQPTPPNRMKGWVGKRQLARKAKHKQ